MILEKIIRYNEAKYFSRMLNLQVVESPGRLFFNNYSTKANKKAIGYDSIWSRGTTEINLVDPNAIKIVTQALLKGNDTNPVRILEAAPGSGLLTRSLLENGIHSVTAFAGGSKPDELNKLKELRTIFGKDRLKISDINLITFRVLYAQMSDGIENFTTVMEDIPAKKWSDDIAAKLFIPLTPFTETTILRAIFNQYAEQSALYTKGRLEIYAFISGRELFYMTATVEEKKSFKILRNDFDVATAFFIKLSPKKDLINFLAINNWPKFVFFVRQTMIRRTSYVISFLEKWAPGCGPKLIKMGIPLFMKFGDLTPEMFLQVYCELEKWEEFDQTSFESISKGELLSLNEEDF